MEKEVKCPWCEKKIVPKVSLLKKQLGEVRERRCSECGKILAAYLVEEGDFLPKIRTFAN